MKFSYNWLKDFVDCALEPQDLGERLTMAGLEIKDVTAQGADYVYEAEITSNRPDWLSVRGIAREVAALTGKKFQEPRAARPASAGTQSAQPRYGVLVKDRLDCPLYTLSVIRGITRRASPAWLRARLELLGCRSVNAIVDITNYIMFEYGTPLHAFDCRTLAGEEIAVRRAASPETIVTIDGIRRTLTPEMLVIADAVRPVAVAGIMGGKETEVSDATTDIVLEAAVFHPAITRKTRQALGLSSESSYRFERGVDPGSVVCAAAAAVSMITDICGGVCDGRSRTGSVPRRTRRIRFDSRHADDVLGRAVPLGDMKKILTGLGFSVQARGRQMDVTVPSWRCDVSGEHDLIEEISRIYGYDRIAATLPAVRAFPGDAAVSPVGSIRRAAAALGLTEVITYSTVAERRLEDYPCQLRQGERIRLVNPVSRDETMLRPTLIPSLVDRVAYNLHQGQESVCLFEIARVFSRSKNGPRETPKLGICLCGTRHLFLSEGTVKDRITHAHVKGVVESLAGRFGVSGLVFVPFREDDMCSLRVKGDVLGWLGRISGSARDAAKIKHRDVYYAEIDIDAFIRHASPARRYHPLPRFPSIGRDISCAIRHGQDIEELLDAVRGAAGAHLSSVRVSDYYAGQQIAPGYRGITLSCVYRSDERTLTEADIEPLHANVGQLLVAKFGAVIR